MKEYVLQTLEKSKGSAYYVFKKNKELLDMLNTKYPHISDLIIKIQLYIRDLDDVPNCKFSGCNNKVVYHTPNFSDTCSATCRAAYMKETGIYTDNAKKVSKKLLNKSEEEKAEIRKKTKKTHNEKYGVDHPMQNADVKKKHKDAVLKNHGIDHFMKSDIVKEKQKQTNLERYGVEYYLQTDDFKERTKQTNLERYGVTNYAQTGEFKEKYTNTSFEKYGTDNYSKTDEYKNRVKQTNLERYGVEYPMWNDEIKIKQKQTNLERYGVDHHAKTPERKELNKQQNIEKYGKEYYFNTDDFKEKAKQTNIEKFGVENPSQNPEIIEKIKQTNIERYGVGSYSKTDEFLNKSKQTSLEKYGVQHPMLNEDIKNNLRKTNMERYGSESYFSSTDYKNKNIEKYGVEYFVLTDEFKQKYIQASIEKYGVINPSKKHYSSDYIATFDNIEEFEKMLYEHGTYKLADLINCDVSTIHKFASNNNIVLPPRPKSYQEEIMTDFLVENNIPFVSNTKKILPSGKELDFYLPDHNLAIEINGLYWHTELSGGKDRNYHYNKWKECDDLGITLLSIQEDEFADNKQFWLNKMLYMTGNLSLTKIHARKCEIRELDNVTDFLNHHHLQGSCASSYKFGLFIENILVSVMTFSTPRNNKSGVIDLSRFCNHSGYIVSGGASKLLSYFIKKYGNMYNSIISFSDNNYSNGNVYKTLGFSLTKSLSPDYKYVLKGKRYHKAKFRKSGIFSKFDIPEDMKNATEWELMQYLGYDRIWDTGKKKWELKI